MKDNIDQTFDLLRHAWYILLLPLFYLFNRFYQYYYQSSDRFIYWDLIRHYSNQPISNYPVHFYISLSLLAIFCTLIFFFNPFQILYDKNRIFGSARFAKLRDIKKLGLLKAKGTVLCKYRGKTLFVSEPLSILCLAPPGTGKSAALAIPTLFLNPNSIIALDVKKELFDITSKHRSSFSHVMVFEPTSENTSCWNPLDKTILPSSLAERYVRVQQIASNIFVPSEGGSDPYWIDSARELFINIAMGLIHRDGGTSIPVVYEASLGDGNISRKEAISLLGDEEGLYDPVSKKLKAYFHTADQQFSGTLGTFDTGLMAFQDPRVKNAVSRCDIKFDDLRGIKDKSYEDYLDSLPTWRRILLKLLKPKKHVKPVTLYLVIKPIDVERLSPLIRVFFESLSKYLLSTTWDKKNQHMITFLLDEFPRLGKMEDIIKMPALSRGQGVNSILIAQDAGQIERVYQKSGREEIMSTTAYKIIPSQNSMESAKLISESIGDKTIKVNSSSHANTDFLKASVSKREQGQKLVTPQKIMSLKFGDCYVISQFAAETPVNGKLYLWFKDKKLLKIAGPLDDKDIFRPGGAPEQASQPPQAPPSKDMIKQFYDMTPNKKAEPDEEDSAASDPFSSAEKDQSPDDDTQGDGVSSSGTKLSPEMLPDLSLSYEKDTDQQQEINLILKNI
jgi:type IV secretion system protein VirD4